MAGRGSAAEGSPGAAVTAPGAGWTEQPADEGEGGEGHRGNGHEAEALDPADGAGVADLAHAGVLEEREALDEDVVGADEQADQGQRHHVAPDACVPLPPGDAEQDRQRVHGDALVPAQPAGRKWATSGQVEAAERGDQRDDERQLDLLTVEQAGQRSGGPRATAASARRAGRRRRWRPGWPASRTAASSWRWRSSGSGHRSGRLVLHVRRAPAVPGCRRLSLETGREGSAVIVCRQSGRPHRVQGIARGGGRRAERRRGRGEGTGAAEVLGHDAGAPSSSVASQPCTAFVGKQRLENVTTNGPPGRSTRATSRTTSTGRVR